MNNSKNLLESILYKKRIDFNFKIRSEVLLLLVYRVKLEMNHNFLIWKRKCISNDNSLDKQVRWTS